MEIHFVKMQGAGNDFILIDCTHKDIAGYFDISRLAVMLCDRRFGIGADQLLLLYHSEVADFRMKIFNSDGGEVEMCGNGIRCLARYIWERRLSTEDVLEIETLAGIIKPERAEELVRVDMGEPVFEPAKIPVNIDSAAPIIDYPLHIKDRDFGITCISMGNPHAVIFLDEDVSGFPVSSYGPEIENHFLFPKKINVEFINIVNENEITMRVWERGSGETMACGTGASAAAVASMVRRFTNRKVTVNLLGGQLLIEWPENNRVYMTGPAVQVFEGKVELAANIEDKRRHPRKAHNASLEYYKQGEPETTPHLSTSMDISESGIGLITEHELEPGQVIIFRSKDSPASSRIAIVQWSMKSGGKYRAGLMFI